MSDNITVEWAEELVECLNDANVGVGANFLIEFWERHEGNYDVYDLSNLTPQKAAWTIIDAFENWKILETDGPGDSVQWDN